MDNLHKIVFGDCRDMSDIPDKSAQLVITSPPYWQLKDYGTENQIGFDDNYQDYINNLNVVWQECSRILQNGCRLCVNIGDQFARSVYYGRYKVIPIRTEIIRFCETIGFDYMGAIIWQKVTTCNTTGGATIMGSFPYPRNGILKLDYEFILIFKKPGATPKVSKEVKEASRMTTEEWNQFFTGHWTFSGEKQDKHIAMFPEELPRRLIKMFSFVGDTVVDPFLGSGTTALAAKNLNRNAIGYEINPEFEELIKDKLGVQEDMLFDKQSFEFSKQKKLTKKAVAEKHQQLPYLFKDPVQFDKKVDVKKLQFGSTIDKHKKHRNEYFKVKKILSPNTIILDNNLTIKLLGISEKTETTQKAIDFLTKKTKGQKVFLKYDKQKYDTQNNLLCYLYLQNKTFINSHLIKHGLVNIDDSIEFKYKNKFLKETGAC